MIGDLGVKVTVMNEIPPRQIVVSKNDKNDHLLSCQSVTLSAQLGATRRVPSTSHNEQPLYAALAPRSVALLPPHLNNGEGCVRGIVCHDSCSKRSTDTLSCSVTWLVPSAQGEQPSHRKLTGARERRVKR